LSGRLRGRFRTVAPDPELQALNAHASTTSTTTTEKRLASMGKISIIGEFWSFLRIRKKLWLAPIVIVLVLLSIIIVAAQGSALAPFIYALF